MRISAFLEESALKFMFPKNVSRVSHFRGYEALTIKIYNIKDLSNLGTRQRAFGIKSQARIFK